MCGRRNPSTRGVANVRNRGEPILTTRRAGDSRAVAAIVVALLVVAVSASAALHESLVRVFEVVRAILDAHPILGPAIFVLLAAVSAMLAFFSSAALIPAGVVTWGMWETAALLSLGWLLGGVATYLTARYLGRPLLAHVARSETLTHYESRIARETPFGIIFLFQLALPSEIPGYVLGMVRYPMAKYLVALALVEIPYAAATVWLGQEFLLRRIIPLVAVLGVGALVGGAAVALLRRRLERPAHGAGRGRDGRSTTGAATGDVDAAGEKGEPER